MNAKSEKEFAFRIVSNQLAEAVAAPKCHKCGCLHKTVEALSGTEAGKNELAPILAEARWVLCRSSTTASAAKFAIPPLQPMHSLKPIRGRGWT